MSTSSHRFGRRSEVTSTPIVTPVVAAHGLVMHAKDGHAARVHAFDADGYALVLGDYKTPEGGRLIRAVDHPRYGGLAEQPA